jgi:hypothetical protein
MYVSTTDPSVLPKLNSQKTEAVEPSGTATDEASSRTSRSGGFLSAILHILSKLRGQLCSTIVTTCREHKTISSNWRGISTTHIASTIIIVSQDWWNLKHLINIPRLSNSSAHFYIFTPCFLYSYISILIRKLSQMRTELQVPETSLQIFHVSGFCLISNSISWLALFNIQTKWGHFLAQTPMHRQAKFTTSSDYIVLLNKPYKSLSPECTQHLNDQLWPP